jgi:hypothetical protein
MGRTAAPWVLICLSLCSLLFLGAIAREFQCVWVDACGVPRLLRSTLEHAFMPGVATLALLLTGLTLTARSRVAVLARDAQRLQREPVVWLWLAFVALLCSISADNLFNLMSGLPLHYHAPMRCCTG